MSKLMSQKRPAMLLLAGCFALSGIVRLIDSGPAFAVELPKLAAANANAESGAAADGKPMDDAALGDLLALLKEREAQLDQKAKALSEKAKVIEAAEAKLREQMERLVEAEDRLASLLRVADNAADKDIEKLVSAFRSMDGKKSGPIFENMDVGFAAGLISRMDDTSAAEILGVLSPEKAYAITIFIAGQNARVPTE